MKDGQLLCKFALPMEWDLISRMVSSVWENDGPEWSGLGSAAGGDLVVEIHDESGLNEDPIFMLCIVYREWEDKQKTAK